ncbi:MAG: hypothetical protein ABIJ31_11450 [Pseudomonadota bacterium]
MKNMLCFLIKSVHVLLLTVILSGLSGLALASGPMVNPAIKQGGGVAATPISIPRPIQLEKYTQFVPINQNLSNTGQVAGGMVGSIDGCDLVTIKGNEMVLSLHYRVAPTVTDAVYSGAFLYDADQQAIDAGYKPNALSQIPSGTTQTILVLPEKPFQSEYVMTFLIQSGKVIINGRFKLPFLWDGQNGKLLDASQVKMNQKKIDAVLENKAQFCDAYANQAIDQYDFAVKHKLSNIVPPVWSNEYTGHYNWCMKVPNETAIQGNELRNTHLKKYAGANTATLPDGMAKKQVQLPGKPIVNGPAIGKPIQTKGFDPGRGP